MMRFIARVGEGLRDSEGRREATITVEFPTRYHDISHLTFF